MKKIILIIALATAFLSCKNDDETVKQDAALQLNFTHNFNGAAITNADYETTEYTNENGEVMTLSKLVYLISDVTLTNSSGDVFTAGDYNIIDAREGTNITFKPGVEVPEGNYTVSFTYGFDDEDNANNYPDLTVADGGWNVPVPLGGGYHYMRLEGKYTNTTDEEVAFQFHNVRANRHESFPITPESRPLETRDTSIEVNLGSVTIAGDTTAVEVEMNVAEWFKTPNTCDLNQHFQILMPMWDRQLEMNANGQNVFSKGSN